ncbi:MarR family transcriptional regulator [Shewanella sp. JM162201]|uniref:MarR family transcriptional regulator n=2 Tax=Shewanella jiangmenensis TaxID=2837387 RepID=A0ABS5V8X2_9GAMM|nr:MarR family transcriptional regulator [Shewanella jiangmenensis]
MNIEQALNQQLNQTLVEFYERFSAWEHHVVEGSGLALPMMHTLELLGLYGPQRMTDLATKLCISTGTLTVRIDKLCRDGLVERVANPDDRRSLLISLTEAGRQLFEAHDSAHLKLTGCLTATLSLEERSVLIKILNQINQKFEQLD